MYKSPIELIYESLQWQMEESIYKVVQNVGINVDKEELIKALKYDREQYKKGYEDAKAESEIIYCGECKHMMPDGRCSMFADPSIRPSASDYCSNAERKEERK